MATLFLEAFGQLSGASIIDSNEEDIYSVFLTRSELMGWGAPSREEHPILWAMEEAELNPDMDPGSTHTGFVFDPNCIGFVQVGLNVGSVESVNQPPRSGYSPLPFHRQSADPVRALPPLVQCFIDSLSRFGSLKLFALQVTAISLEPSGQSSTHHIYRAPNWFNIIPKSGVDAIISFDQSLIGSRAESELVEILQRRNDDDAPFEFGTSVVVPKQSKVKTSRYTPRNRASPQSDSDMGVSVTMPEWTPSAVGWTLASVLDAARAINPDASDSALRITRV